MAFKAVARELEAHDAPAGLPEQARAAAQDEMRHAALMESMATRWGVQPRRPRLVSIAVRSLEELAVENAAEGCVRETWAAVEASYQACRAKDPVIRRAMLEISTDEVRHVEFSWELDAWARTQLDRAGRERVERARRRAADELLGSMVGERDRNLCIEAGMPSLATARSLARDLDHALWA